MPGNRAYTTRYKGNVISIKRYLRRGKSRKNYEIPKIIDFSTRQQYYLYSEEFKSPFIRECIIMDFEEKGRFLPPNVMENLIKEFISRLESGRRYTREELYDVLHESRKAINKKRKKRI